MKNSICSFCIIHISNVGNIPKKNIQLRINMEYQIDIYFSLVFDTQFSVRIFFFAMNINSNGLSIYSMAYTLNSIQRSS